MSGATRLPRLGHWRGGISSLADQFVVSLTNFATGIIIARACDQAAFGQYMLGLSLVLFVQGLQNSIVSVPYTFYSARFTGDELEQYTVSATFQQLILSIMAAIALLIAGFAFPALLVRLGIGKLVLVVAAALSLILFKEHIRRICFSRLKMRDALLVDMSVCILQLSSLFIMMSTNSLTVSHAFIIIGLSCLLPSIVWAVRSIDFKSFNWNRQSRDFRANWRFASWMLLSSVVFAMGSNLFPWYLSGFQGNEQTGALAACLGIVYMANPFVLGLANYLGPKAAVTYRNSGTARLNRIVRESILVIMAFGLILYLVLSLYGVELVNLVYGGVRHVNGSVISLLVAYYMVSAVSMPIKSALIALGMPRASFRGYLAGLAVAVSAGPFLVYRAGLTGAAVGLLLTGMATTATLFVIYYRIKPGRNRDSGAEIGELECQEY